MFTRKNAKYASTLLAFAFAFGIAVRAGITAGERIFPSPPIKVIHSYVDDEAPKG